MGANMKPQIIHFQATCEAKKENSSSGFFLRIRIWEDEKKTLSQYTSKQFFPDQINAQCKKIIESLSISSRKGEGIEFKNKLKGMGRKLCDDLLNPEHKQFLSQTTIEHLILELDDHLVHIPWELLYIDTFFLSERFSCGRQVETQQRLKSCTQRLLRHPLKMWILTNTQSNLKNVASEGLELFKRIHRKNADTPFFEPDLDSEITADKIKENIREYDIVHFAGHGIFNLDDPGKSAWELPGKNLTASDIYNMAGSLALPSIVFSNACQSARTEAWDIQKHATDSSFGLANAFMYSGVKHYIGTFGDIPDNTGGKFALTFYDELVAGRTIGQALKQAKLMLINQNKHTCWANYIMYGDPTDIYAGVSNDQTQESDMQDNSSPHGSLIEQSKEPKSDSLNHIGHHSIDVRADDHNNNQTDISQRSKAIKRFSGIFLTLSVMILIFIGVGWFYFRPIDVPEEQWISRPMNLAIVFDSQGDASDMRKENLISHYIQMKLKKISRFTLVERMDIAIILKELKLWMSEFSSAGQTIKPDLLPAELILYIDIKKGDSKQSSLENDADIFMRLFHTQFGKVVEAYSETISNNSFMSQKSIIADRLILKLMELFPLRGNICMVDNKPGLNIGADVGVKVGQRFQVVDRKIVVIVNAVESGRSFVSVDGYDGGLDGLRVEVEY